MPDPTLPVLGLGAGLAGLIASVTIALLYSRRIRSSIVEETLGIENRFLEGMGTMGASELKETAPGKELLGLMADQTLADWGARSGRRAPSPVPNIPARFLISGLLMGSVTVGLLAWVLSRLGLEMQVRAFVQLFAVLGFGAALLDLATMYLLRRQSMAGIVRETAAIEISLNSRLSTIGFAELRLTRSGRELSTLLADGPKVSGAAVPLAGRFVGRRPAQFEFALLALASVAALLIMWTAGSLYEGKALASPSSVKLIHSNLSADYRSGGSLGSVISMRLTVLRELLPEEVYLGGDFLLSPVPTATARNFAGDPPVSATPSPTLVSTPSPLPAVFTSTP